MNNAHNELISNIMRQRENNTENKEIHLSIQGKIFDDVAPSLLRQLNNLIDSNAVSLSVDQRSVVCNIKLEGKNIGNPLVETRCNGVVIPQFVHLSSNIINPIYDTLDVHFAEAYDIKIEELRKMAYNNYKKILREHNNKEKTSEIPMKTFQSPNYHCCT